MYHILIVEDDDEINKLLADFLAKNGYSVTSRFDGLHVLDCLKDHKVDLILLDLMLPYRSGDLLLADIRKQYTVPVIVISARETTQNKIDLLRLGADDYITKPFRPLEMVARVKAQLRRYTRYSGRETEGRVIAFSGLVLNKDTHECCLNERQLSLTPTEFAILWHLCENRGRVVSADELFQTVWGEKYFTGNNNTVMVHIRHLREKMKDSAEHPRYIKTVWGVGYKVDG